MPLEDLFKPMEIKRNSDKLLVIRRRIGNGSFFLAPSFYTFNFGFLILLRISSLPSKVEGEDHQLGIQGCDASLLLDDTPTSQGEKTAAPNLNSLRGFEVIDNIKSELESVCPQTVSCADILTVAARDSVVLSGGPTWDVEMGRRDSLTASFKAANSGIPTPTSDVATLTSMFQNVGLSQKDMVALSGAHTIGKARCKFSTGLNGQCGSNPKSVDLAQLDEVTPIAFDNFYFKNLLSGNGFLPSDQTLASGNDSGTVGLVQTYAEDLYVFFEDFKDLMVRMGRLGSNSGGEIRRSCKVVN